MSFDTVGMGVTRMSIEGRKKDEREKGKYIGWVAIGEGKDKEGLFQVYITFGRGKACHCFKARQMVYVLLLNEV